MNNSLFENVILGKKQKELLCIIVETAHNLPPDKRQEFLISRTNVEAFLQHPGLHKEEIKFHSPDLEILIEYGLIQETGHNQLGDVSVFNVHPKGFLYYKYLKEKLEEPVEQIEETIHGYIDAPSFQKEFPTGQCSLVTNSYVNKTGGQQMSIRSYIKKYNAEISAIGAFLALLAIILFFWKPNLKPFSIVSIVMAIPELALRIIVILLFILTIYIIMKIRPLLNPDILDLPENFKNHKKGEGKFREGVSREIAQVASTANYVYNRFQKYEELDRDDEIRFILEMVGNTPEEKMMEEDIREKYFEKFQTAKQIDFNSLWKNYLVGKDFIEQERDSTGYGVTEYYCITSKGYAYLKYRKIDNEENDKETPQ